MNRNVLYLIIAVLVVVAGVASYLLYQNRQQTAGVDISVDGGGISIKTK